MSHLNILQLLLSHQWITVTQLHLLLVVSQRREVSNAICGDALEHLHHVRLLSNL
jgi:hypothetical protein